LPIHQQVGAGKYLKALAEWAQAEFAKNIRASPFDDASFYSRIRLDGQYL
jgi:hypothetical protein